MDSFDLPAGPLTDADRYAALQMTLADADARLAEHRQAGLNAGGSLPALVPLAFDAREGRLATHAVNGACRVSLYLGGHPDGNRMIPTSVAEFVGTCKDYRRRRYCSHTLAAIKQLQASLKDQRHPLREKLFHLSAAEPWRDLLKLVDSFVARNPPEPESPALATPEGRIVWRIEFSKTPASPYQDTPQIRLEVLPYEQRISKNGKWTRGRKINFADFAASEDLWTHEADRRAANYYHSVVSQRSGGYGYDYGYSSFYPALLGVELLDALVGHPLVFWSSSDEPAEVARGEFGLLIAEEPGGWRILPAIDGHCPSGELIWKKSGQEFERPCWLDREHNRVVLGRADKAVVTLAARLTQIPGPIPPEGQPQVLARLALVQARLPITLPASLGGGSEPADHRLYLRLTPQQPAGVSAELVVVPVAERAAYAPGEGPAAITVLKEGKQFHFERRPADERRRAGDAVEQLRLNAFSSLRPWQWMLPTNDDALDLLGLLADQPVDDLVVQWPQGAERTVSRTVQPAALRVRIEQQRDWFGLSGTVEIDGQQVELQKILAAMRKGQRYIEVGPRQFVRLAQTLRQSLQTLDDVTHESRSGNLEFDITAAPAIEQLVDPGAELQACLAWDEALRKLHAAEELTPDPPITLQAELRDYQLDGYRWLARLAAWGMGGCLADDMGLGKTVQTLAALIDRIAAGPALVVAPTSVAFNWVREAQRFAPTLKPILYRETDREDVLTGLDDGDVLIASYGLLLRDVDKLAKVKWGTLVLDEAQKIKNSATKTAQAARQIEAGWRLALTGTPLENHLGELWSIFRATTPGLLGSWDRFRTKFAEPIERQKDASRRRALARLMRPFILRRTKSEVLEELPERTEIVRTAEMTAAEQQRYQAARLAAIADLAGPQDAGEDRRFQILAALTKLRQLACHPRLVDREWPGGSAKLDLFMEIVEELREGQHRALVFSQFVQHLSLIRAALDAAGVSYQYLDGQTPAAEREKRVDAFQRGEGELFLISLKAGGTGLNLTAADYVIHMDPWWNPAVEDQATDRAHRIGQTRPVTVYRLVTKDTIEEQILALHAAKRHLVADVLEGTDQAGKLSSQELVSLIRGDSPAEVEQTV